MNPMPATRLTPAALNARTFSKEEVFSLGLDVHQEALKRYLEAVTYRLTGPDPQPVFIPQIDRSAQIYRGLLPVPHGWPKTALKA
jgi:hypothetical protein